MAKRIPLHRETPAVITDATHAFDSELRLHLIRFFSEAPARQADAVHALGVERSVITSNVNALLELGVLVVTDTTPKSRYFATDQDRVIELADALRDFITT